VLLISPSFGMKEIGTVYLNPPPPLRDRITIIANVPGVISPARPATCLAGASINREDDAISRTGARTAFALVIHHRQFTWLRIERRLSSRSTAARTKSVRSSSSRSTTAIRAKVHCQ
jgi:hypothetical protein